MKIRMILFCFGPVCFFISSLLASSEIPSTIYGFSIIYDHNLIFLLRRFRTFLSLTGFFFIPVLTFYARCETLYLVDETNCLIEETI